MGAKTFYACRAMRPDFKIVEQKFGDSILIQASWSFQGSTYVMATDLDRMSLIARCYDTIMEQMELL